jgi:oligopeptide/dipeptide ABC transporter ATP-binding protein
MITQSALFEIRDLRVSLATGHELVRGVNLRVEAGKVLGVVGESGSGKSISMLASIGLSPRNARVSGSVRLSGEEILGASPSRLCRIRGAQIGMVFQDPLTALNPVIKVGDQIAEAVRLHHPDLSRAAAFNRALDLLELTSVPQPARRAKQYSHELSGGMRQRAMIAMAVANSPKVLIADEPTTALDVTVQAQIMEVLSRLRETLDLALVLITHDMGLIAGVADRVAVMYCGRVVETGSVDDLFNRARHPYTKGLLGCLPKVEGSKEKLVPISGNPPSIASKPPGCPFHPRCPLAQPLCSQDEPALREVDGTWTACHFAELLRGQGPRHQLAVGRA